MVARMFTDSTTPVMPAIVARSPSSNCFSSRITKPVK